MTTTATIERLTDGRFAVCDGDEAVSVHSTHEGAVEGLAAYRRELSDMRRDYASERRLRAMEGR